MVMVIMVALVLVSSSHIVVVICLFSLYQYNICTLYTHIFFIPYIQYIILYTYITYIYLYLQLRIVIVVRDIHVRTIYVYYLVLE